MRILQLVSAFAYSGPAAATLTLAQEQRALGHVVTVGHDTVRPEGNAHEEGMGGRVAQSGLPVASELKLCTKSGPLAWMKDRGYLKKRMASVDVVHAHFSHDHTLAALARGRAQAPLLVRTVHSERSLTPRAGQGWLLKKTDALLVHAQGTAQTAAAVLALDPGRFHVVRGPVDLQVYHTEGWQQRGDNFRQKHALTHAPMVLMAAIFQKGRGQERVLKVWPKVQDQVPGAQLVYAGLGELREEVMQAARGMKGVHFVGYLDEDLPDAYVAANVTLLCAMGNDGYGRSLLESMACGTPGVVPDLAPLAEVVSQHGVGAVYPRGDDDAMVSALVEVLAASQNQAGVWAPRCREAMEKYHAPKVIAAETLAVYEGLLVHRLGP